MKTDRERIFLLVPERTGDTYTTRVKQALVRKGPVGREELLEIAKGIQEKR